ncbi:MAG: hypothetical protein KDA80_04385 [Planctomycetaceae bacterium]|nr:hypothetical protein [Planctomycetaceae bacterium]
MDFTQTHIVHDYKVDRPLMSCCYSRDGAFVFVGSEDYKVWRFNVAEGSQVELDTDAWVRAMCPGALDGTLVTGGYDGRLIIWDAQQETPAATKTIDAHQGWIRSITLSPDRKLLASAGNDLVIRFWDAADGTLVRELKGHESYIYNLAFHPSGNTLVSGDLYGNLFDWDVATWEQKRTWKSESLSKYDKGFRAQIGGFRGMIFSADGNRLACSGITNVSNAFAGVGNPSVVIFDYNEAKQVIEHLSKGPLQGVCWNVALHPEKVIIGSSGGSGGHLLFWKEGEAETFHQLKMPSDVRDFALSPDHSHVAAAHGNGHLSICKLDKKA